MSNLPRALSFAGRAGRAEFWTTNVAVNIASLVLSYAITFAQARGVLPGVAAELASLLLAIGVLWFGLSVLVRRGHDRGRPAIFSVVLFVGITAGFVMMSLQKTNPITTSGISLLLLLIFLVMLGWQVIDYAFWPGQPRTNRYGSPGRYNPGDKTPPLVLGA